MKPSIPKGTRDFGPVEMARRNYIFNTIREVYALYGYRQIETPSMELLSTLMGKYGEEGDKLLFKILNSGDFTRSVSTADYEAQNAPQLAARFCEKGLRYDLTVPFARYVVQHREELQLPFKRFQIQPVWRADRPQKGRYREFYQCDADVVGSDSLVNEVELLQIVDEVYRRFGIRVAIKINNRKILTGIAEVLGAADRIIDITVAIDKFDKIGLEGINAELLAGGLTPEQVAQLQPIITLSGTNAEKLATMRQVLAASEVGLKGIDEVEYVLNNYEQAEASLPAASSGIFPQQGRDGGARERLGEVPSQRAEGVFDLTLARGLNYYTGCIFEVKALDVEIGSINGGGRYDNLTGIFGLPGLSGVGISFGADRIYDVLTQLDLFPREAHAGARLLFINFGEKEGNHCLGLARQTRQAGIPTEVYPDAAKMKKQMQYANALQVPYVALVGEQEMQEGLIALKDMQSGEQQKLTIEQLIEKLR